MIDSFIPTECHLWKNGDPSMDQLRTDLITIKTYEDDSDLIRELKKCRVCGQLYFYEFYEWTDWEGGNDPQYRTWIPVQDISDADTINELSSMELLRFSGIRSDYPSSAKRPSGPRWIVKQK